jgi:hypothetical protein
MRTYVPGNCSLERLAIEEAEMSRQRTRQTAKQDFVAGLGRIESKPDPAVLDAKRILGVKG